MKTIASIALLAINLFSQNAAAECWTKGPNPPQYPIQLVQHLLTAGYGLQSVQTLSAGTGYTYSQNRNKDDKDCFTFEVKNNGKAAISVDSVGAMDAWMRELMGCDHGGHSDYGSMNYAAHFTCKK